MPLAPNPVLEAFMTGRQQKIAQGQQAIENKQRQQQLDQQAQEFQANLDELTRQHESENNRADAISQMTQAQMALQHENEVRTLYEQQGLAPSGSTVTQPSFSQPYQVPGVSDIPGASALPLTTQPIATDLSGIPSGQVKITDAKGQTLNALTPEAKAQQDAKTLMITQGPIIEKMRLAEADKAKAALELEKLKISGNTDVEQLKIASERLKEKNEEAARLADITLQNKGRVDAALARGTNTDTATKASTITNRFQTSPDYKTYTTLKNISQEANSIPNDTKLGSDDTELAYLYAKSQDPNYALRGDKFNVVKENAQTISDKFGIALDRISSSSAFLTPAARQQMKDAIARKEKVATSQYELRKTDTVAQLKKINQKPEDWIPEEMKTTGASVGSIISVGGKSIKVTKVYPDGTFDGEEVK